MEPHPWNTGFAWQRPADRCYRVVDGDQADQFHQQGFVLVEDAFRPGDLEEVTAALDGIDRKSTRLNSSHT